MPHADRVASSWSSLYGASVAAATRSTIPQLGFPDLRVYVSQRQRVLVKDSGEFNRVQELRVYALFDPEELVVCAVPVRVLRAELRGVELLQVGGAGRDGCGGVVLVEWLFARRIRKGDCAVPRRAFDSVLDDSHLWSCIGGRSATLGRGCAPGPIGADALRGNEPVRGSLPERRAARRWGVVGRVMTDTDETEPAPKPSIAERRAAFNSETAAELAQVLEPPAESDRQGAVRSVRFFADDHRLAVVAGPQEEDDVELALAYAVRHAQGRSTVLVLPEGHVNATAQRIPWLRPSARPSMFVHATGRQFRGLSAHSPRRSRRSSTDSGVSPEAELADAMMPLHLGDNGRSVGAGRVGHP